MNRPFQWWVAGVLALILLPVFSLAQQPSFYISCEGKESTGGGVNLYQYELLNTTGAALLLTDLRVATDDMNPVDYTNIVSPPGFNFALGQDTLLGTTTVKTPHGAFVPNQQWVRNTAGLVHWNNPQGLLLAANATAVFGFDNPNPSEDMEWVANAAAGQIGIGLPAVVVAGPLGTFTNGPVHGPVVPEPTLVGLAFASMGLLHRRRPT